MEILSHHFRGRGEGRREKEKGCLRDDFVAKAGEEEDGDFGDAGYDGFAGPDLVAQQREVSSRWYNPSHHQQCSLLMVQD
jgi:hypothetical protein